MANIKVVANIDPQVVATKMVERLEENLRGRSGFDHVWDGLDSEVLGEVRDELRQVFIEVMLKHG